MTKSGQFSYEGDGAGPGTNQVLELYTHGPDLSGTLGGAGGIGGILSCHGGTGSTPSYYHYDGNGNVIACADTNGAVATRVEYGPFGAVLVKSGSSTSRYQFSSKEFDSAVELNYYGFRYYSPMLGQFILRDPLPELSFRTHPMPNTIQIGGPFLDAEMPPFSDATATRESGLAEFVRKRRMRDARASAKATPLYVFVKNAPVNNIDPLGLELFLGSYGKYCGPDWCGGKQQSEKECACNKHRLPEPDNRIDACCKTHDLCLGSGGGRECDDAMCECVKGVDPINEPVPPGSSLERQFRNYHKC